MLENLLWSLFETDGGVDHYLNYKKALGADTMNVENREYNGDNPNSSPGH